MEVEMSVIMKRVIAVNAIIYNILQFSLLLASLESLLRNLLPFWSCFSLTAFLRTEAETRLEFMEKFLVWSRGSNVLQTQGCMVLNFGWEQAFPYPQLQLSHDSHISKGRPPLFSAVT